MVRIVGHGCVVCLPPAQIVEWDHSLANWVYELPNAPISFADGVSMVLLSGSAAARSRCVGGCVVAVAVVVVVVVVVVAAVVFVVFLLLF